jgi:hypothetical protein
MANPSAISEGAAGLKLDVVTNLAGAAGLKRGYDAGTPSGAASPAVAQGVAVLEAGAGATATVAAATATAAIAAVSAKTGYLAGFSISGGGATAGSRVVATITGLLIGTLSINIAVPAGAAGAITPIFVTFPNPIPASAVNTAITLSVPSFGTGNLSVAVAIWGYVSA